MKSIVMVLFFIGTCYCEVEFNERPRNVSLELLYHTQSKTDGHGVISPFGIWTLMMGVAVGATGNSYKQIYRAINLPKNSNALIRSYKGLTKVVLDPGTTGVSLISRNFVFLDNDFNVILYFRSTLQDDFGALIKVLDFDDPNSARIANMYMDKSGGRVSKVLSSDDFRESGMIFTNVVFFRGLWSSPFNKSQTVLEPFYNENNEVIGRVNMMFRESIIPFSDMENFKAFVAELPYGNDGKYSMIFLLPYPNVKTIDMYKNFATISLQDVLKRLQDDVDNYGLEHVDVRIPRFKISTNIVMNKPLNDMGVYDIFQPDLAKFERATTDSIFVSVIVQTVDIEVTESGTVASASTSATLVDSITSSSFHANRPFVYFVMEKSTTTVVLSGIYSKPTVY